jgi:hypothetical protein
MTVRAALLDENGVYLRMDEVASRAELTERHLAKITSCDLAPGAYRWIPDKDNPFGGAFWPLEWLARVEADVQAVAAALAKAAHVEELRAASPEQRRGARSAARVARALAAKRTR